MIKNIFLFFFVVCINQMSGQIVDVPLVRTFDFMIDFQRNDTVFRNFICFNADSKDSISIKSSYFFTKLTNTKWISSQHSDGTFIIAKFRKKKPSKWFVENNQKWLNADFECKEKGHSTRYEPDGSVLKSCFFLNIAHSKKMYPKIDRNGNTKPVNIVHHRIQKGETLSSIAKKYYTTEERIIELNKFKNGVIPKKGKIRVQ